MSKSEPKSYKTHKAGSRKGSVHEVFDKKGDDAARDLGLKLKLKNGTLTSWFGTWRRAKPTKATPKKKEAGKSKAPLSRKAVRVKATRKPNSNVATLRAA